MSMDTKRRISTAVGVVMLLLGGCRPADARQEAAPKSTDAKTPAETESRKETMKTRISKSGYDITPLPREKVAELAKKLDPEAYRITQSADTERPFCGTLLDNKKEGFYACVVCGLPLFSSEHKFHSGTGWPSFFREFDPEHVARKTDASHGMARTEINCARCSAHLGHVFDDGPKPTGERHCLNSASLKFYEKGAELPPESRPAATSGGPGTGGDTGSATTAAAPAAKTGEAANKEGEYEVAYFAGGCFWGVEHYFQKGPGVIDAVSGYMQGEMESPTYQDVCTAATGHAESVKVVFDPKKITYRRLLEAFFVMHDPTQLNYQGPDEGEQYRSGIWTTSEEQRNAALAYIEELTASNRFGGKKIVTQVEPAKVFYPAETYHQDYIAKTGRACHVKNPW